MSTAFLQCPGNALQLFSVLLRAGKLGADAETAQKSLRAGLTFAKVIYADTDSYVGATPTELAAGEPSLTFTAGPADPASPTSISVANVDDTRIVMAAGNGSYCYFIRDSAAGSGTQFAGGPGSTCDATHMPSQWTSKGWR